MMNSCNFAGNLTKDPELTHTNSGTAILKFSIAVNERVKVGDNWQDKPNYFDIVVWGKRGEGLARFLSKGSKVAVQCKARWQSWEKDGVRRSKVEFHADDVDLMSKGSAQQSEQSSPQTTDQSGYRDTGNSGDSYQYDDEDVPF